MTQEQLDYLNRDFKKSIKHYIDEIQKEWRDWLKEIYIDDLYERIFFEDFGTEDGHFTLQVRDLINADHERKIRFEIYARAKDDFVNGSYPE